MNHSVQNAGVDALKLTAVTWTHLTGSPVQKKQRPMWQEMRQRKRIEIKDRVRESGFEGFEQSPRPLLKATIKGLT